MELCLSRLGQDPHIDGRALQECLQASALRRGSSQRDQQVRDRADGLGSKIQFDTRWIGNRARADADHLFQNGDEETGYGPRLVLSSGHSSVADFSMGSRKMKGAIGTKGHDLRHRVQDTWQDIHEGEERLRASLESAVKDSERDLPTLGIQRNIQQSEHELKSGVMDATRLTENPLPGIDTRKRVRKGERELKVELHKLRGESLIWDLQKCEHGLGTGFDHAAGIVERMLPGVEFGEDIRKGEHELKGALERDGQRMEKMMPGL